MLNRSHLHPYQQKTVDLIIEKKRLGCFLGLGLGKTVSTLTAALDLLQSFSVHKVLVIAPLRVSNSVWAQEALKWEHLRKLRVSVCTGSQKRRLAGLQMDADIYVINRENADWLVEQYGTKWPFDMVVIDESSSFKNPSSKRFRGVRRILPYTNYMVLLTGTPSPNGLLDLWAQIYLIDLGRSLGRTMTAYKQRFFEQDYMGYNFTPREGSAETIHRLINPFTVHMSADDYLDLPPRIDVTVKTAMPPAAWETYRNFERTLLAELDDGEAVEAVTAAVLANKLLQYANGGLYTDDKHNWSEVHTAKLDALAEIIEDNAGENVLVSYNYKFDLERLLKRFPDAVVLDKQQETIDRWNRGEIKLLLAHPASAGHGLNIQAGGSLIVWFGLTWSLENYLQFNARLHRQGQLKPVRIIHIVTEGTIDERVLSILVAKDRTQQSLLAALKPNSGSSSIPAPCGDSDPSE